VLCARRRGHLAVLARLRYPVCAASASPLRPLGLIEELAVAGNDS
jgi:hypothetical protein